MPRLGERVQDTFTQTPSVLVGVAGDLDVAGLPS